LEQRYLSYKSSRISYLRFGTGPKPAFCFHGYGEEAGSFSFLTKHEGGQYTFFAMDLPFHGHTEWNEGLNCTINDIKQIIEGVCSQENFKYFIPGLPGKEYIAAGKVTQGSIPSNSSLPGNEQLLSLVGFSLGGRIALSLYQEMPSKIEKLILLAPDGLVLNPWYWLATQTWPGNKLFAFTMRSPQWFFAVLKGLNTLKLVNTSIFKFVSYYIGDKEVRRLLYARWTTLRKLKPDLPAIKSFVRSNKTAVRLLYGKHDRIILPVRGEKFRKGIDEYCRLTIIESGHQVLHERYKDYIHEALNT
jgi:pimeloyl-ACP methyl ester carboxylesterase